MGLLDDPIEDEIAQRRSIEKFLMEVIYPKLSTEKRKVIDKHVNRGVSISAAFEFAGVKHHACMR